MMSADTFTPTAEMLRTVEGCRNSDGEIVTGLATTMLRVKFQLSEDEAQATVKEAYEAPHPETKHGAIGNGREKVRQVGDSTPDRFTADTAAKTGQSERSIQRDAERGECITPAAFEVTREMTDAVQEWRTTARTAGIHRPVVPYLRDRFGIGNKEAVEIVRTAELRIAGGANDEG